VTGPEHTEQRIRVHILRAELEGLTTSYDKSIEVLKPALEEARSIGNTALQAQILGLLGRLAMWRMDIESAKKYNEEALALSRTVGNVETLIFNLRQVGNAWTTQDPARGLPYLEESVELARKHGDRNAEAHGLNSVGIAQNLLRDFSNAEATYLRVLELNRSIKNRVSEAMVLQNLSGLHANLGDLDRSEKEARESMAIARELGSATLRVGSEIGMADVCLRRRQNDEARTWIRAAGRSMREIGSRPSLLPMLYGLLRVRTGDRATGLRWIGFTMANDSNIKENELFFQGFRDEMRGDWSDERADAALEEGASLNLEEILAEAEKD